MSNSNSDDKNSTPTSTNSSNEWFETWFDSHYYHILYKDRDDTEARLFIDNLSLYLNFLPNDKILDLACGKGRHSIYLNQKGLLVEGIDLSEESINYAKQFENDRLHFSQHDMRKVYKTNHFDFILNLFTSFGYFQTHQENQQAIEAMAKALQSEGRIVLDFFNTKKIIESLVRYEEKMVDGITFKISKSIQDNFIVKDIHFEDKAKQFHFQERVRTIPTTDFLRYFRNANLTVARIFGDYDLSEFEEEISDRMIFIVEK